MSRTGMRLRRGSAAVAAVLALLATTACTALEESPSPSASASDALVTLDDTTRATLQSVLTEQFRESGMPGVAALVTMGDQEWTYTLGVGDLDTDEPYDPDAHVRIASNTKPFVATAVLQLVDEGVIGLEDPLDQYVAGITDGDAITIRDLLQMTSGVWEFTADEALMDRWMQDPTMPWTVQDTIELLRDKPAQFEPGEKVVYTDSNYILLGEVIEVATGEDASSVIRTRILEPLGLDDTDFPTSGEAALPDPHQQGYRPADGGLGDLTSLVPVGDINPEVAWTAGAMTSTLDEMAAWAVALADGDLLSDDLQTQRLQTRRLDGVSADVGYGLGILQVGDFLGHDGAIMGYSSVAMRLSDQDTTFVLVGNASSNSTTPTMDIFRAMIGALYPAELTGE